MEPISEALMRFAKSLEEPCDAKKMFHIGIRLAEVVESVLDSAVRLYCKTKDEKFLKTLQAGSP